jgi:uncharacterized membrane protein
MDKEVVFLVPSEAAAYDVVKALKGLDDEGSIELYASTVVVKTANGAITIKDTRHLHGGWATVLGLSTGALIGLLGGPAGVALGAAVGAAAGLGEDLAYSGFAGDFVNDVEARLQPGGHAVVASVWEDWTVPVDVAVKPIGAVVFRQATDDIVVAQIRSDMQSLKEEQAHLDAEISHASAEARAKLEARRNELRAKQNAQREKLQARAKKLEDTWAAKVASIKAKTTQAKAEVKARHEQHLDKLSRFAVAQKSAFHELFA